MALSCLGLNEWLYGAVTAFLAFATLVVGVFVGAAFAVSPEACANFLNKTGITTHIVIEQASTRRGKVSLRIMGVLLFALTSIMLVGIASEMFFG